jgi:hypothetical protein
VVIAEVRPPGEAQMFGVPVAETGRLGPRKKNISLYESKLQSTSLLH